MPQQTVAPLLNIYKQKFLIKRIIQNLFGGLILAFDSDDSRIPFSIYLIQLVLFFVPFLIGGILILITDVAGYPAKYASLTAGLIYMFYLLTMKLILTLIANKNYLKAESNSAMRESNVSSSSQSRILSSKEEFDSVASKINFIFSTIDICIDTSNNKKKLKLNKWTLLKCFMRILFDSVLAGYILSFSVYFESFIYLQTKLQFNLAGSVCIFIFNWFVFLLTLYSLTIRAPTEPAIYQAYDNLNIQYYSRAFYVISFQLIEIIFNFALSNGQIPVLAIFWLKIVINCLPIAWLIGILPPIDAFFLYFFEQCYIHLYGGSATCTNLRLLIQLGLACVVSLAHFIPNDLAILIIFAIFGYILSSIDLIFLTEQLIKSLISRKKIYPKDPSLEESESKSADQISIWKDLLYHFIMICLILLVSILSFQLLTNIRDLDYAYSVEYIILHVCIGFFVLAKVLGDLQSVYIFFGMFRNPFYPTNCLNSPTDKYQIVSINQDKIFFKITKYLRVIILRIVAPLLLCAVVSIDCSINKIYGDSVLGYWRTICVLRAFRWIWQSSFMCLFEMSILANIAIFDIGYSSTSDISYRRYFLTGCLIASFARDRIEQFLNKLFTYILLTITAWTVKKQRSTKAIIAIVLNFILFFPLGLLVLVVASFLSAPLLPLFTFPIFLIGFPRTKRFWPQRSNFFSFTASSLSDSARETNSTSKRNLTTADSSFYAQLVPQLLPSLKELVKSGSLGSSLQADQYFLSRFQDRIIWIQIMESSCSYCIINIKGLELQETSCHTRESQYIDDCFDLTFENTAGSLANSSTRNSTKCLLNLNPFNCMRPCDILLFDAYSDAKNSLVGVLDNPESLNQITLFYPKVLHYFLVKFLLSRKIKSKEEKTTSDESNGIKNLFNKAENNTDVTVLTVQDKVYNILKSETNIKRNNLPSLKSSNGENENRAFEGSEAKGSDWTDSSDSESEENKKPKNAIDQAKKNTNKAKESIDANPFDFDLNEILGTSSKTNKEKNINIDIEYSNRSTENANKKFELESKLTKTEIKLTTKESINSISGVDTASLLVDSNTSLLTLPVAWTKFLNDNLNTSQSQMNDSKLMKSALMSTKWIENLIDLIEEITEIKLNKKDLLTDYENGLNVNHFVFVLKCCMTLGINENKVSPNLNPFSIQKFFAGELPWTPVNERLAQDYPKLYKLLIKSFQYTIKMVLDHVTICPISDDDELIDTLRTYEQDWFIGTESEPDYAKNILNKKKYLFSLYKDPQKKSLNSRTLSIQKIKSPLAKLNSEIVKSIWSSTNLELLFMTNDDDERYSIQAHQYILRNLTIQSSDPPLGYCIYNSENIYLPCVNPFL